MNAETILCIAGRRWDSLWRSTQQYMFRFAAQNRVVFFEPGRNPDKPVLSELARNFPDFFQLRAQQLGDNLSIVQTPSSVPYAQRHLPEFVLGSTIPYTARLNSRIRLQTVSRYIKRWGIVSPILWLYSPMDIDLVGKLGEKLVCYFVYDEYADFIGNESVRDLFREYDHRLVKRADLVFTSSRSQWERRINLNPHTYFIPNAADFDHFHKALDPATPIPEDIVERKKPIIGFAGWLGWHIDVELLVRVAEVFSHCSVVLIGPDELPKDDNYAKLTHLPNVFLLGRKEINLIPGYLKLFDVALLPYNLVGHILSAYPLKLHEYLAAGRAIVAVNLPELKPYRHIVRVAETHAEFMDKIREALLDCDQQSIEARVAIARENTWDNRVAEMYRVLKPFLLNGERPNT